MLKRPLLLVSIQNDKIPAMVFHSVIVASQALQRQYLLATIA
jgi:hypothetical protein